MTADLSCLIYVIVWLVIASTQNEILIVLIPINPQLILRKRVSIS